MAFLVLDRVSKGYGAGKTRSEVLTDVSLTVEEGELVAVVGYSGAGKTTLISMVAGLQAPDAGTITLEGRPITGPGPRARAWCSRTTRSCPGSPPTRTSTWPSTSSTAAGRTPRSGPGPRSSSIW